MRRYVVAHKGTFLTNSVAERFSIWGLSDFNFFLVDQKAPQRGHARLDGGAVDSLQMA
jgi:hypothetical protein